MKFLCIDSTSSKARVAVVEKRKCLKEKSLPQDKNDWWKMIKGDVWYLVDEFLLLIDQIFTEIDFLIEDIDYICYSWFSGFYYPLSVGKILANTIWKIHNKEVIAVDHITAHYFSYFVNKKEDFQNYPILFFSASGSHNSIAILKNEATLNILNDKTYFSEQEDRYIWLWHMYYKILRKTGILMEGTSDKKINEILSQTKHIFNPEIVKECMDNYDNESLFDVNYMDLYSFFVKEYLIDFDEEDKFTLFFSFQEALFRIIETKFSKIAQIIPYREICIVWGISNNDDFIEFLQEKMKQRGITISRPAPAYRFDNAAMLWVLAYYMKKENITFPSSNIIT